MSVNLAIVSPSRNAYSETFIQAHKELDANIFFYYGGFLPKYDQDSKSVKTDKRKSFYFKLKKILNLKSELTINEIALIDSFKRNKINIALAEYGITGVKVLNICKKLDIPLIVHFHGYDASQIDVIEKLRVEYELMFRYAYKVISVSRAMTKSLMDLGCPFEKIVYNPYGPNDKYFDIKISTKKKQFISVGRFVEKKAPYLTILAFKEVLKNHPEAILIMCGDGVLLPICKDVVHALGIEKSVIFKGAVDNQELFELFPESIAFVQHSIVAENGDSEGTPVAILEAGAAALPVISTFHAGISDVVIHDKTGYLVNEKDTHQMSHYMNILLNNPTLSISMGKEARDHIRSNYPLKKHLDKINQIIYDAVSTK